MRVFLIVFVVALALALFGHLIGLVGCVDLPELSLGPCKLGRAPDSSG